MSFLSRLFGMKEALHPILGKLLLIKGKHGAYWEAETTVFGNPCGLAIETKGEALPSDAQLGFYLQIIDDLDAAFARAAPLLVPQYEEWTGLPFPAEWRSAFRFVGMKIPLEGRDTNPWNLSFDCLTDKAGHMFTCYFEHGRPSYVTIDG
jgi:hypothetical protein